MGKTFKDQRKYEVKELIRKSEKLRQKNLNRSIKDKLQHQIEDEFDELANKGYTGDSMRHRDPNQKRRREFED